MPQNNKIKIRRGLNAALPTANTEVGELRYSTDTKELYIDDGATNVKIGGDPTGFPVSTATQGALDGKSDFPTVNSSVPVRGGAGAQASVPFSTTSLANSFAVRNGTSELMVGTPLTSGSATPKSYVDTADALKVNRNGSNTMTGALTSTYGAALGYNQTRGGVSNSWGTASTGRFALVNGATVVMSVSSAGLRVGNDADNASAAQMLQVNGNARINGVDYIVGTGFPNGVVSAPVGSVYIDTAVTAGITMWVKKSGVSNTGWVSNDLSSTAPASATASGTAGQRAYDANYYYICTATNTWRRTAISSW